MELEGIQFIVNRQGEKTAVVIDLAKHAEVWEDFYDGVVAEANRGDPTISLDDLRADLGFEDASH